MTSIHVRSIDLILDKPEYEVDVFITFHSREGKVIFYDSLHGATESRAFTTKTAGKAVEEALRNALLILNGNSAFDTALMSLKQIATESR